MFSKVYGRMRKAYLEEHRPGLYTRLILSGMLYEHLAEIDACCSNRKDRMIRQLADTEGVKEGLKARNQLMWVGGVQMRTREQRRRSRKLIF